MKCTSCDIDIDPKWKHAIEKNTCPSCGQVIMPEDLKDKINILNLAISEFMDLYPDQLDDWIYSNFNYVKIGSDYWNKSLPKQKVSYARSNSESEDNFDEDLISVQSQEVTSKFFKNAEVSKTVSRTQELKKMVSDIKSQNPRLNAKQNLALLNEDSFQEDSEDVESSLDQPYEEEIPSVVQAFAKSSIKEKGNTYNAKDALSLDRMQEKIVESRRNMMNGGRGSFSRG